MGKAKCPASSDFASNLNLFDGHAGALPILQGCSNITIQGKSNRGRLYAILYLVHGGTNTSLFKVSSEPIPLT